MTSDGWIMNTFHTTIVSCYSYPTVVITVWPYSTISFGWRSGAVGGTVVTVTSTARPDEKLFERVIRIFESTLTRVCLQGTDRSYFCVFCVSDTVTSRPNIRCRPGKTMRREVCEQKRNKNILRTMGYSLPPVMGVLNFEDNSFL